MGKRIIQQRRGRGTPRYLSPSHRYAGEITYRKYDDKERNDVVYGKVDNIITSSGHSAPLLEVFYDGGEKCLIMAPENLSKDSTIASGKNAVLQTGNILPLVNIPEGSVVCGIEANPGGGPVFCRSSGTFATVVAKSEDGVTIKFPSNKLKKLNVLCRAMIGVVAGGGRPDKPFVKAGNKFHALKIRNKLYPKTSAVAMNATDNPFGSGRGRHKGKCSVPPRHAPPGRNVGLIRARRTGHKR
mgnify:CR=1 FL=1